MDAVKIPLIPVQVGNGLVVLHTREEWLRLVRDVDLEAAARAVAPIEPKENP